MGRSQCQLCHRCWKGEWGRKYGPHSASLGRTACSARSLGFRVTEAPRLLLRCRRHAASLLTAQGASTSPTRECLCATDRLLRRMPKLITVSPLARLQRIPRRAAGVCQPNHIDCGRTVRSWGLFRRRRRPSLSCPLCTNKRLSRQRRGPLDYRFKQSDAAASAACGSLRRPSGDPRVMLCSRLYCHLLSIGSRACSATVCVAGRRAVQYDSEPHYRLGCVRGRKEWRRVGTHSLRASIFS